MTTEDKILRLSSSQEDILHLWIHGTLVPGESPSSAKVAVIKSSRINTEKKERLKVRVISDNHISGGLVKSSIIISHKRQLSPEVTPLRTSCSYSLRASAGCIYTAPETMNTDDVTYCRQCQKHYIGVCTCHFVLILNKKVSRDGSVKDRARLTAPWPIYVSKSQIEGGGEGVWTSASLPQGLVFGPYEGHTQENISRESESGYAWHLKLSVKRKFVVDSIDKTTSNWLRYVNCPRTFSEMNLEAFQYKGNIYYVTLCDVESNSELMVWYGDEYGKELGILSFLKNRISMCRTQKQISNEEKLTKSNKSLTGPGKSVTGKISTLELPNNFDQNRSRIKLSKSQSEVRYLFKAARLEPRKNNGVKVRPVFYFGLRGTAFLKSQHFLQVPDLWVSLTIYY
nr:PR domain-containing protein 11-like [Cherax quadricarinatus]